MILIIVVEIMVYEVVIIDYFNKILFRLWLEKKSEKVNQHWPNEIL